VQTGDIIDINLPERRLDARIDQQTLQDRVTALIAAKKAEVESNFLRMYGATTLTAAHGALRRKF
jgi:dihydroxyacid dehydratase/phosphogluconate dehydratase